MTKYLVSLAVALALNAAANLMMKFGMRGIDTELAGAGMLDQGVGGLLRLLLRNWVLLAGLGCFALNVVFYTYALQKLPISMAYPIMTVTGFAIIVVVSGYLLSERLTTLQWVGVAAILIGAVCVARDAGRQMGAATGQNKAQSVEVSAAK
jgi:undecaprenyl phosphate-alpha-L-ara4N flippase subunit ArnF